MDPEYENDYDPYTVPVTCQVCKWVVQVSLSRMSEIPDTDRFVCSICTGEMATDRDWDLGFSGSSEKS